MKVWNCFISIFRGSLDRERSLERKGVNHNGERRSEKRGEKARDKASPGEVRRAGSVATRRGASGFVVCI